LNEGVLSAIKMDAVHSSKRPIGIFDSGIGGLTVARAVSTLLPNEDIIYFGDTAHMPYGEKSASAIQSYCIKICNLLLSQDVKVILIACNSASAAAYDLVKEYVGSKALVLNVIDPMVHHVSHHFAKKKVGLIATKATVNSNVYKKKIDLLNLGIKLQSLATPLLAPMIEEGFAHSGIIKPMIEQYLSAPELEDIEALILGCTHYPIIQNDIKEYYHNQVAVLDSSEIVAEALNHLLGLHGLLNTNAAVGKRHCYVSDYTPSFAKSTATFFGEAITLEPYPLWE